MDRDRQAEIQVREFLYLDVERVKSAIAQLNEGLVENEITSSENTKSGGLSGKASLLDFGSAEVTGGYLRTSGKTESTVRHDFAFNLLEAQLLESRRLRLWDENTEDILDPSDYVLVEGKIAFDDFKYLTQILESHQKLMVQLNRVAAINRWTNAEKRERNSVLHQAEKEGKEQSLPTWYSSDLVAVLRVIFGDSMIVRSSHKNASNGSRVAGPLSTEWLRDSVEHLRYKYGLRPAGKWRVFGQVTSMPPESRNSGATPEIRNPGLDDTLDIAFSSLSQITSSFDNAFEVKISPIAIYRERPNTRRGE